MTRKEDRITTDIDGRYNFKLEYETNYKVWLDKHSPGIFNLYKDTSFYISTIGFNQPLDYKLDISLDAMLVPLTPVREGYDATKPRFNKNVKPVISVTSAEGKPQLAQKEITEVLKDTITKKDNPKILKKDIEKLRNAETAPSKPQLNLRNRRKNQSNQNGKKNHKTNLWIVFLL